MLYIFIYHFSFLGENETLFDDSNSIANEITFELPTITLRKRVNCICHQLELIIGGIFEKNIRGHAVLRKVLDLLSAVRRKKVVHDYVRENCNGVSMLMLAATRWSSLAIVLSRFKIIRVALFEVNLHYTSIQYSRFQIAIQENVIASAFTDDELEVIDDVTELLIAFRVQLMLLQAGKVVTISKVFVSVRYLLNFIENKKVDYSIHFTNTLPILF